MKHEKIIHAVRLDEVIVVNQREAGFPGFVHHGALAYAVVLTVTVPIDDAQQWPAFPSQGAGGV